MDAVVFKNCIKGNSGLLLLRLNVCVCMKFQAASSEISVLELSSHVFFTRRRVSLSNQEAVSN